MFTCLINLMKGMMKMKKLMGKLEELLELGGTKKDITLLIISAISLVVSLTAYCRSMHRGWL